MFSVLVVEDVLAATKASAAIFSSSLLLLKRPESSATSLHNNDRGGGKLLTKAEATATSAIDGSKDGVCLLSTFVLLSNADNTAGGQLGARIAFAMILRFFKGSDPPHRMKLKFPGPPKFLPQTCVDFSIFS